ncbi:hypothetical protein K469DRAFT_614067, partial [Zopfia rhizophila CBS 207.26]
MFPFSRDHSFVGREDIMAELSDKRKQLASRNHIRLALVGLGGVGNPTRFEQGYRSIADKIPIPGREDPNADILQLVYAWLSDRRNGQWLMILDNADDDGVFFADDEDTAGTRQVSDLATYRRPLESLLPQTPNGSILVTSRNRIAAMNLVGQHGSIVQVGPMDEEDALALLKTRVPFGE